ncbi:hypothetical protein [Arenimonas aestuarii]
MSAGRGLALAAIVVVVAALAMGLWASGSPGTQREFRLDERRVTDLQGIVAAIGRHYELHRALPPDLDALAAAPGSRLSTSDPVTGTAYDYEIVGARRYRVCASFAHDTAEETFRMAAPWWHGAGRHCFEQRVGKDPEE